MDDGALEYAGDDWLMDDGVWKYLCDGDDDGVATR